MKTAEKHMKWGCLAPFLVCIVLLFAYLIFSNSRFLPDFEASFKDTENSRTIKMLLYSISPIGRTEYSRDLVVETVSTKYTKLLSDDWGGNDRVSVYTRKDDELIFVGTTEFYIFSNNAFLNQRLSNAEPLGSGNDLNYVGVFRSKDRKFAFATAAQEPECLETLMQIIEPIVFRPNVTKESCD